MKWESNRLVINQRAGDRAEVLIYDAVGEDVFGGGLSAESFIADLRAIDSDVALDVRINSPGGSVFDGLAIYNLLSAHPADVTVWVDGVAASIASLIAMAGDSIRMPKNARLMIHRPMGPSAMAFGDAGTLREAATENERTAALLESVEDDLVGTYVDRTGQTEHQIREWMQAETWFNGPEAVAAGFADEVTNEAGRLAASFDLTMFQKTPKELTRDGVAIFREATAENVRQLEQLGAAARQRRARAKQRLTTARASKTLTGTT